MLNAIMAKVAISRAVVQSHCWKFIGQTSVNNSFWLDSWGFRVRLPFIDLGLGFKFGLGFKKT